MTVVRYSVDELIREGASLKKKIGVITRSLKCPETCHDESRAAMPGHVNPATRRLAEEIGSLTSLPYGLGKSMSDIFAMVCSLEGVENAGIYVFNKLQKRLDLVCHYNVPEELRVTTTNFGRGSWQVNAILSGHAGRLDIQSLPLSARLVYEKSGIENISLIPLINDGRTTGCLHLSFHKTAGESGFGRLVLEGLAERIARVIALGNSMSRLDESIAELAGLLSNLYLRFPPKGNHPELLDHFFSGIRENLDEFGKAVTCAADKVVQRLKDGQKNRSIPFTREKVDALLHDAGQIVRIIGRMRLFSTSHPASSAPGKPDQTRSDAELLKFLAGFNEVLHILIEDEKMNKPAVNPFLQAEFIQLEMPVRLTDLKFSVERLTPN